MESKLKIIHPLGGEYSIEDLQKDVNEARKKYGHNGLAFTYVTVQALIHKIIEQDKKIRKYERKK